MEQLKEIYFPPYITLAHMFHAPDQWSLQPRVLKQYQLQYVLEGEAEYEIEGNLYHTTKGDLLFHAPGEVHRVATKTRKPYVCISVVFHFGETAYPVEQLIGFLTKKTDRPHDMGNFAGHPLENKLSELIHQYKQPGFFAQQQAQQLLMNILLLLGNGKNGRREASPIQDSAGKAKLILLRNYIDSRLREGFQHKELEELSGWSRNYIISQFKRTFGMSPIQYLVWARLEKAKELALQSGYSFSQIAEEVGYSNIHSLGKAFKQKTGMSMSQFVGTLFKDTPDR
ncbi:helix-turn-helix domain-containing protein [Paenibacillus silvisoli]|uniref:helix-turn-helix domain-containing protein n=1 Tax=Paenibacillus silvisoli TaxID=3110539 RepID=UPI00280392C5|nr:AraC family transcriptional regulator [Paenibacillus silvisoli]